MTTINGQPQTPPVVPSKDKQIESRSREFLNGNATQHQRGQTNQGSGGQARSNSSLLVSQTALEQLLETPQDQRHAQDESSGNDGDDDSTRVLITLTPESSAGKQAEATASPVRANQEVKVDEVAKLVWRQVDAALRSGPTVTAQQVSLSIPLDASTGLKEVQVMMNDGVLTVTVVRSADQAQHDIKQAALSLAQTLQSRYPGKTIKVAEKIEGATGQDQDDPAAVHRATQVHLSDLFAGGRNR